MDVSFWRDACGHFERVLDLPPTERAAYLGDLEPELRHGVEALFQAEAEAEAGEFLETPALSHAMGDDLKTAAEEAECLRLGPYLLERELSCSGMSRVFLARRDDGEFEKQVAVKVIARDAASDELLERFLRERQILATLDHPNIARLLDGGTTDEGLPYLVMELVEGAPIDDFCDVSRLTIPERLDLFRQVCAAVDYAHDRGVVHRDIKASNILVTEDGAPKLLDFGIAKLLQPPVSAVGGDHTSPGMRPMTPYYASPEQVTGGAVTRATDVYALGVLLFKLLSGRFPYRFPDRTVDAVRAAVVEEDTLSLVGAVFESVGPGAARDRDSEQPAEDEVSASRGATPASLRRELAGDLNTIVQMALRKAPERRYETAHAIGEDLRRYVEGLPVAARGGGPGYRTGKLLVKHRTRIGVGVVLAWALAALSLIAVRSGQLAEDHEELARQNAETQEVLAFVESMYALSDPPARGALRSRADPMLEAGAQRAMSLLSENPELGARIMESIGGMYAEMGFEGPSEKWLSSAASIERSLATGSPSGSRRSMDRGGPVALARISSADSVESPVEVASFSAHPNRQSRLEVSVSGSCPEEVKFSVTGATPRGPVLILSSFREGSTTIGREPCPELGIGLATPTVQAATVADGSGKGEVVRTMATRSCDRNYYVEAIDVASCGVSPTAWVDPRSSL